MIGYSKLDQVGPKKKSQTQKNADANKELDRIYAQKFIDYCEAQVSPNCLKREVVSYGEKLKLTYAHRHKRIWYRSRPHLLYSFNQTIKACLHCHDVLEYDRTLSAAVFARLRWPWGTKGIAHGQSNISRSTQAPSNSTKAK